MVFHDEIYAERPAQIRVDLVIVVAPAFIHPSIDVGDWYRAIVLVHLVNLDFSVAEDPGRRLPQRTLIFAFRFRIRDVIVLRRGSGRRWA